MRILVLGATGQIGSKIIDEALKAGHQLNLLIRKESTINNQNINLIYGDVLNKNDVRAAMIETNAVISAIGPGGIGESDKNLHVLTEGMQNIIHCMTELDIHRLIALGSIATLQFDENTIVRDTPNFPAFAKNISGAHLSALNQLRVSTLDWTVIAPPMGFGSGERTGVYKISEEYIIRGETKISYADIAHLAIDILNDFKYYGKRITLSY